MKAVRTMSNHYKLRDFVAAANKLYPHMVFYQVTSAVLNVLKQLLLLAVLGQIINLLSRSSGMRTFKHIALITILFLILTFFVKALEIFISSKAARGKQMLNIKAQANMAKKLNSVNYSTYISNHFRKLYSAAKTGFEYTGGFDLFISNMIHTIATFLTTLLVAGGVIINVLQTPARNGMSTQGYEILIVILLCIPLFSSIFFSKREGKIMEKFFDYNMKFNRALDYYSEVLFREIKYAKFLRIYDPYDTILGHAECTIDKQVGQDTQYQIQAVGYGEFSSIITSVIIGLLYCILSFKVLSGSVLMGTMVICVGYLQLLIESLGQLFSSWSNRKALFTTMQQYLEFMDTDNTDIEKYRETTFTEDSLEIEFRHVYFKFHEQNNYILSDINLTIKKDQKIAIVGPNGSGKSTLIKLLLRLYTPTKGRIFINGTDISTFDLIQYQEKFGVVFQDFNLFAWSIKENIIMGKVLDPNKLNDVLEMVGLEERIKSLPDGTETSISQILNENGVEFSGGEQQKIAIARALYREAPVVIMDEPTAALDPISEADIFNNFDKLTKNKTAIFISHRMSSTQFSDLIYVLEEGKIIDQGTHQMLMEKEGLYYEMYNEQAQYYRTHSRDQEK